MVVRQLDGMPRLVVAFLCGVAVSSSVPHLPGLLPLSLLSLVLVVASVAVDGRRHLSGVFLYLAAFVLGAVRMAADRRTDVAVPLGEYREYECVALDDAVRRGKTLQFDAVVTGMDQSAVAAPYRIKVSVLPGKKMMSVRGGMSFRFGAVLSLPVNDKRKKFDYRRYLHVHGFKAQAFVFGNAVRQVKADWSNVPLLARLQMRASALRRSLGAAFSRCGIEGDNLAVVYAMTLGDKRLIDSGLRDVYSVAGASHVLALSGLHLGIIYTVLIALFGRGVRLWRWRMLVQFVVLSAIWAYVVLVGMPVSAVRSALMLSVGSLVMVSGRQGNGVNALFVSALVVVALSPVSIYDVGFQMSFLAVASILLAAKPLYRCLAGGRVGRCAPLRWLAGMLSVSLAAQIGVAPLTAYCFGRFSCYFLLANVFAVPLATMLLYGALAMLLLSGFPLLQSLVASAMNSLSQLLNDAVTFISSLPGASVEDISLSFVQLCLVYLIILSLFLIVAILSRRRVRTLSNYRYPDTESLGE